MESLLADAILIELLLLLLVVLVEVIEVSLLRRVVFRSSSSSTTTATRQELYVPVTGPVYAAEAGIVIMVSNYVVKLASLEVDLLF